MNILSGLAFALVAMVLVAGGLPHKHAKHDRLVPVVPAASFNSRFGCWGLEGPGACRRAWPSGTVICMG